MNERLLSDVMDDRHTDRQQPAMFGVSGSLNLPELLRILRRRAGLLVGTVLLLTVLATLAVFQLTPRYTATTKVMIEPAREKVVDIEAVVSGLAGDAQTIRSEIAVIQSRGLIGKLVNKLNLDRYREFNPVIQSAQDAEKERFFDWRQWLPLKWIEQWLPLEWIETVIATQSEAKEDPTTLAERERVLVIDSVLRNLVVSPIGHSRVIGIDFTSADPRLAARISNTLADLYIVEQLEAKFEATRRATEWLNDRLSELRSRVEASEQAVETFRGQSGLIQGRDASIVAQQITELNSQLIIAQTEYSGLRSRLQKIEELFQAGGFKTVLDLLGSVVIGQLREQETELGRRYAELSSEYGPKHPVMVNIRSERRQLNSQLEAEARRMIEDIRSEVAVALERVRSFELSLDERKAEAARLNTTEVKLRQLEREAVANQTLFETFLNRFKETEQSGLEQPDARIISPADVPANPSFPKTRLILSVVMLGAIAVGVGLAFAAELLESGYLSTDEIERELGVRGLGLVPKLARLGPLPHDYVLSKPMSAYAESMRTLFTGLMMRHRAGDGGLSVLFTSTTPSEGKTSTVASLGRVIASSGRRTCILDCDLRRPRIHSAVGIDNERGIVDYLRGNADLDELIQSDESSGVDVIASGRYGGDPQELLRSDQLHYLIKKLKERYSVVLVDSPPVLPVSDSKILANICDQCVLVAKYRQTRRSAVRRALQQLQETDATVAGVVLSEVDVRRHAKYGYGDSGYYHGKYREYYAD